MKFIVSSNMLLKQLNSMAGAIATNPLVPILENFLFEINKDKLTITASDLQTTLITEIHIDSKDEGSICVQAKILLDTLKNLPEQPVIFTIDLNTYGVELRSDNGTYKLAGENATDFPKVPQLKNTTNVDISSEVLTKALGSTVFAASSDEARPAMAGVYFQLNETNTSFVATDGHRLARYRRVDVVCDSPFSIIVPKKALGLLKNSLPQSNEPVTMSFNSSHGSFMFGTTIMFCRLIDERYPEYENVIPQDNPRQLTVNRRELLDSLKRVNIYSNKTTHQVRMKMQGSDLQVSAEDLDFSNEAVERLACEYTGEDMEIGFNAKFLLEVLSNLDCEAININMSQPNRAGLITPVDKASNEDILMLVMPVMLAATV